jgi:hypothetical protein
VAEIARIAHRGNTQGPRPELENTVDYIHTALNGGYWVETDVQCSAQGLVLGHDCAQEPAPETLLMHPHVICHAKDLHSLLALLDMGAHCFWHEQDRVTITSRGLIWCYPGHHPQHASAVWLDLLYQPVPENIQGIFGICSDKFDK